MNLLNLFTLKCIPSEMYYDLLRKNSFMISIDLKDAYHTIKIREDFQCF